METWRKNFIAYRERAGLSPSDLARKSNVSTSMISLIESGGRAGKKSLMEKLAKALDCSYSDIFSEDEAVFETEHKRIPNIGKQEVQYTEQEKQVIKLQGEMIEMLKRENERLVAENKKLQDANIQDISRKNGVG
jgi:transcriptional regulator with XRE-family HTH domain